MVDRNPYTNLSMKKIILLLLVHLSVMTSSHSQDIAEFSKGGKIHRQVLALWDNHYRDYWTSEIKRRLIDDGDVYVLYDVQIGGLQSFVEMNRRCGDTKQLKEIVAMLNPVFAQLRPIADQGKGWICTGGTICPAYNLLDKEVPLCSSQFLGLLGAVATAVTDVIPEQEWGEAEQTFLRQTANTMAVHLNRWLTPSYFRATERRAQVTKEDITDGSSRSFFTDRDLWYLTILSDLAELHQKGIIPLEEDGTLAWNELQQKKKGIGISFDLFIKRISLASTPSGNAADLDKGYWRHFYDNRYARYDGEEKPVVWESKSEGATMVVQVPWDSAYLSPYAGWDISHARRLVPALESFARNQQTIRSVWGYENPAFDPIEIRRSFAVQIVEKIWNKDKDYPLFTNFWSGDNGWYRVAYAAQTGRQFSGYPPYGLSNSIPEGGYPIWGTLHPTLDHLFRRLYELGQSEDETDRRFMSQHYSRLMLKDQGNAKRVPSFSFLSDLVESR